jgi:hypothetical protein
MGFWGDWQATRERRHRVGLYLNHLLREPEAAPLAWLTALTGNAALAARELTFARRALGLIVAERDALDDRTAADVAHQLAPVIAGEARRDAAVGREWADRWRAYTAALAVRGSAEAPAARLARVMLSGAGVHSGYAGRPERTAARRHRRRVAARGRASVCTAQLSARAGGRNGKRASRAEARNARFSHAHLA